MSIIAAGTTTTTALSSTGNTDGTLQFQVNGTTASVTLNTLGAIGVGSTPNFGTAGQALVSGGSTAAPTWASVTTSPAGSNTQIQYNNSGSFGASSGLTFDGTKLALSSSSAAVLESIKSTSTTSQSALFQVNNDADVPFNIGVFGSSAGTFGVLGASTPFVSTNASTLNLVNTNASGSVVLGLGSSATERFRFASAGQLGIGGANYGTSGQVLTSGGPSAAPSWASPSSAMTLISTTTASSSSTVDITSGFTSTYDMYMVVITNMTVSATSTAAFWAQMYIGGSLQTSLYSYNYGFMDTGGYVTSGFTTSSPGDSRMYLAASGIIAQVGAPRTINAVFYIPNPSSTSVNKYMYGSGTTASATGGFRSYNFFTTAGYIGTGAMTGVSFYIQSGTIVTGKFRLYGISN